MKATHDGVAKGWPFPGRLTWENVASCERSATGPHLEANSIVKERRKLLVSRLRVLPGIPEVTGALAEL